MCGFVGARHVDSGRQFADLQNAVRWIARRGPDSLKRWTSPDRTIEIVHARLAIVDQGGLAHQPMTDPETGTTVAFNGEIYNYPELRSELAAYPYRTDSDTEVILSAYRQWGIDAVRRFRGMFSMVIVDGRTGTLHLVRDPVGKKPLFLAEWDGGILFGSSALALAAATGQAPSIDPAAVDDYWLDGHVSPARSLFKGCRPVLPGEAVECPRSGVTRSFRFTAVTADASANGSNRERLSMLLGQSVRQRLRDNPHPVALLSGGIDSTVVTAALQRFTAPQTLTLGALVPWTQDERYARYAARRLRVPLTVVSPSIGRIEDEVDFSFGLQDEPLGMMSFLPLALLLKAVKPYGRILLTGDGGDEVFLGYGRPADWTAPTATAQDAELRSGPEVQGWMSSWGRRTVTHALIGHMFTKLDRASAEQGIEVRCPLLDWDVMTFARALDPAALFGSGCPKHLLKDQLNGWPSWFLHRKKIGFAYNLRWAWAFRGFAGLRDRIDPDALATFGGLLPAGLRRPASQWTRRDIWRNFPQVWKLLAWSGFLRRVQEIGAGGSIQKATA